MIFCHEPLTATLCPVLKNTLHDAHERGHCTDRTRSRTRREKSDRGPAWRIMKEKSGKRNSGGEIMEQVFWEAFGKHLGSIWDASEKHVETYE